MSAWPPAWGRPWAPGLVLALVVALTACVGPSRTASDYESKARNTAEQVRSSLETVRLGLDAAAADRATLPYLSRLFGDAEEDAGAAQTAFEAVQPPDAASDEVRAELGGLVDDAVDALAAARIAIRRDDVDAALDGADELAASSEALQAFLDAHGG